MTPVHTFICIDIQYSVHSLVCDVVTAPPQLTVRPASITRVVVNANLSFTCASQAIPPASTVWLIDDSNLVVVRSLYQESFLDHNICTYI